MSMRGCVLDEATGFGFADRLCSSSVCAVNHEESTGEQHWAQSLVSPTISSGSTPPPPPAPSSRVRRDATNVGVRTLAGTGVAPEQRPNLRAPRASNTATQRFIAESAALDSYAVEPVAADPYAANPGAVDPYAADPAAFDPYAVDPAAADAYAVEADELEAEAFQPYPPPQPFAAEEPASARMPKLILPPPPPQFSTIKRGERLLPERSNDPKYYPGLVNDPEPLPELERKLPAWGKYAAAGVAVFIAGLIVRGVMSGPPTWSAVIDVTPPDARVQVDGQALEGTASPRTREGLIAGDHVVLVEAPGYVAHRQVVTLSEADRRIVISLDREPPPKKEEPVAEPAAAPEPAATAAAAPAAAEPAPPPLEDISKLSKKELAKRRRAERVAERYRARKSGAAESGSKASAKASAPASSSKASSSKTAAASGSTGLLKVNSTPWSEVYVDRKHVGHTPLLGLVLPAGRHTVELKNPDTGAKKKLRIKLKAGETLVKIEKLGR